MKTIEKVHDDNFGLSVKHDDIVTDSLTVARMFDKQHKHVLRDIERIIAVLKKSYNDDKYAIEMSPNLDPSNDVIEMGSNLSRSISKSDSSNLRSDVLNKNDIEQQSTKLSRSNTMFFKGYYTDSMNRRKPIYYMTRDGFMELAGSFTGEKAILFRHEFVAAFDAFENEVKILRSYVEKQKSDMDKLNAKNGSIDYIKANTIANKAVSTLFGFPKAVKKEVMTDDMLNVRSEVMNDIITLMNAKEFLPADFKISEAVYSKWNP